MANVIQTMIHNTLGDGARSTKFDCLIGLDSYKKGSKMISTFVKTASFPGKSHEVIDLKFKGRNIPVRGQTKYENTWSCTFYLDEMHSLKKAFEDEIEMLDIHSFGNISSRVKFNQSANSTNYTKILTIVQLDFDGTQKTAVYNLYNVFPKSVSQVDTDYSEVGKIQEFTVEFSYSHFDMQTVKGSDGSFVDGVKGRLLGAVEGLIQRGKEAAAAAIGNLISSAKDYVMENGGSEIFGAIGSGIDSALLSLEQIDFNPGQMLP